jgi:hypothetical protein
VVVAVAFYVLYTVAVRVVAQATASPIRSWFHHYARSSLGGISLLLVLILPAYWLLVQVRYLDWMPPRHYAFLKDLAQPPFRGASFVVNNYAAPVAAYTGGWAYFDPAISQAYFEEKNGRLHLAGDRKYLWFADRNTNLEYRRPDYFVCMIAQSPAALVNRILRKYGRGRGEPGCSQLPLVRLALDERQAPPGLKLVAYDRAGMEAIGFDSWAIIKLDWSNQPSGMVLDWELKPLRKTNAID